MKAIYTKEIRKAKKPALVMFSIIFLVLGTITLLWSFYPVITFQISSVFANRKEVSPLPKDKLASSLQKGLNVFDGTGSAYYSSYLKDFTKVGDWFPKKPQIVNHKTTVTSYNLSVSKIGVSSAKVVVAGEDLANSLVQYGDTVVPGEIGNVVVLGHSTLPQLYKDGDYKSIFTYLPSLERGDKIKATVNGFSYEYVVYDMFVVNPSDVWVLNTESDEATITLISCVPPGTFWQRLIVKGKLTGFQ